MSKAGVNHTGVATAEAQCRHHWLIESPHGPMSTGICKLCRARREFRNSAGDRLWKEEPLSELAYERWGPFREFRAPVTEAW
jgi:hypothetical protein